MILFVVFFSSIGVSQIVANFVGQAPTCPQGSDGSLCCTSVTGGIPPYTCTITSPVGPFPYNSTTNCFSSLASGPYTIHITDNYGNSGNVNGIVPPSVNPPIVITASITNASCGLTNGSACCTVTGGSGSYTYLWIRFSDFATLGTGLCQTGLDPNDSYSFTVYDSNTPCFAIAEIIVDETTLSADVESVNSNCVEPNCDGSASITLTGVGPYNITWTSGGLSNATHISSTVNLTGLCPGTYTGTVTDANGCVANINFTINLEGADVISNATIGGVQYHVISVNTTWDQAWFSNQSTIIVDANVYVSPGVTFNIVGLNVLVTPQHSIRAVTSSTIAANNSVFDVICGDTWRGFEIQGSGINGTNRSKLVMNNCTVRHAESAISNHNTSITNFNNTSGANTGGIITVSNSRFEDNVNDLRIANFINNTSDPLNYSAKFDNCVFQLENLPATWEFALFGNPVTQNQILTSGRIRLLTTNDTEFTRCRLINLNPAYSNATKTLGLNVKGTTFTWIGADAGDDFVIANYNSQIAGWRTGIEISGNSGLASNASLPLNFVTNTRFQNHQGLITSANVPIIIANNRFDPYPTIAYQHVYQSAYNVIGNQHCAIYMNNLANENGTHVQQFFIAHNRIENSTNLIAAQSNIPNSYGMYLYSTGILNNFIVEDSIINCGIGMLFTFINKSPIANSTVGVHYECNYFKDNSQDVLIAANTTGAVNSYGVASQQGWFFNNPFNQIRSAGNNFVDSPNTLNPIDDVSTTSTGTLPPHFYRYNNMELANGPAELTTPVHTPSQEFQNFCDYDWRTVLDANEQEEVLMRTELIEIKEEIATIKDRGETAQLLNQIGAITNENAILLYEQLSSKSPTLSQEVLLSTIQKEYEMPNALLADILESNPQAAKDYEILCALAQKSNPLDEYQNSQVMSGQYWQGELELLYEKAGIVQAGISNEILMRTISNNSVVQLIEYLDENNYDEAILKSQILADYHQIENALELLEDASNVKGSTINENRFQTWSQIIQIKNEIQLNGVPMSEENLVTLENHWHQDTDQLGELAYSLLVTYAGYPNIYPEAPENLRSIAQPNGYLEKTKNPTLDVWPVPCQNYVNVKLEYDATSQIKINVYNNQGQLQFELIAEKGQSEFFLSMEDIPVGLYYMSLFDLDSNKFIASKHFSKR